MMRWVVSQPVKLVPGRSTRVVGKFLFLPYTIGRDRRWLEFVRIEQLYSPGIGVVFHCRPRWHDVRFVDKVHHCEIHGDA